MNKLRELRDKLQPKPKSPTGTVISASGQSIKVRTAQGVIDARSVDSIEYNVGDEVLIREGVVRGKVKPADSVPVYFV